MGLELGPFVADAVFPLYDTSFLCLSVIALIGRSSFTTGQSELSLLIISFTFANYL